MAKIYKITNLINNKIYIGQNNEVRKCYFGSGTALRKAIKKYGRDNFIMETLVSGDFNQELLNELEKHYIRVYNSYAGTNKYGYNLTTGGEGSVRIITAEGRKNMSIAQKGKNKSEEFKLKVSNTLKGRVLSEKTIIKMSKAQKGRIITEEAKKKISRTLMGHVYNKGILKSEEHKIKLREANLRLSKEGYRIPVSKYVYQYDLNGNLVKKYNTVTEASKELKMSNNKILDYSRGVKNHPIYKFIITKEVLHEC